MDARSNVVMFNNASILDVATTPPTTVVTLLSLGNTTFVSSAGTSKFTGVFGPTEITPAYAPLKDVYSLQQTICGGNIYLQGAVLPPCCRVHALQRAAQMIRSPRDLWSSRCNCWNSTNHKWLRFNFSRII